MRKMIEAASALDVEVVCTLAGGPKEGKDKKQTIMEDFPEVFGPIVDEAEAHGLKIAFENWFATNLQGLDHFQAVLDAVPSDVLGFNFDPSHLFWQQIDYIEAVHRFGDRIFHTHAKDAEILPFRLRKIGVLGRGWWRYRIPGWGDIDWTAYITALKEVGYDYVLSIEHEDPFFSPEEGFLKGKEYLQRLV
ncbi:TPA: sugar phosphate isomerase/epimerase [Candidatus Bathyarchaeota archaeon]|nr:sugar phosphate isomerase/epimerase [Candidatus Bathyarchaeota archaeon]